MCVSINDRIPTSNTLHNEDKEIVVMVFELSLVIFVSFNDDTHQNSPLFVHIVVIHTIEHYCVSKKSVVCNNKKIDLM